MPPVENLDKGFQAESARRHTSALPSRGLSEIPLDHKPSGRMERRLPIIVVVRLAKPESAGTDAEEKTFTDNISLHGARIFSQRTWQADELVRVTPLNERAACGKVVYCQRLPDDRCSIGVQFQDRSVAWRTLQRHDGLLR
jgi:hypothetical protein